MRIGSLCSGAGGLDMAVERVFGATTAWHAELDPAASKVLAYRWPGVPNHGDLIATDWSTVEPVDIICAGWPCQPFSLAGKQRGAADERAIWPHIARAVRVLRPRIVVLENVSAVLVSEFGRVADSLGSLGYDFRWTCLRAADIGAPHRRERLFVVADICADLAANAHCGRLEISTQRNGHATRPELAASLGRDADRRGDDAIGALLPTPAASDGSGGKTSRSGDRIDEPLLGGIARDFDGQWGKYAPAIARWANATRPAPSPTEPNAKGKPRLSAAFSEWLMGWPAGHVTEVPGISRNDALRIIGNGVVPQQAEAALRYLLSASCEVVA